MQMMSVLKPIAFDVLKCMSQLFDYYLYAVSMINYIHDNVNGLKLLNFLTMTSSSLESSL